MRVRCMGAWLKAATCRERTPRRQVGAFECNPARIGELVAGWFGAQRGELREMAKRAKALGHPHALLRIVEDLHKLAHH